MADSADVWYVRLPDGRVLRAGSTAAVRHHLEAGRIPPDSRVRRSAAQAWSQLERTGEFADLVGERARRSVPKSNPALETSRPVPPSNSALRLETVGVRGLAEELVTALDSALVRGKMAAAALLGVTAGVALLLVAHFRPGEDLWGPLPWVAAGAGLCLLHAFVAALLTQTTVVELSRLRPATTAEARAGLLRNTLRLWLAELLLGSVLLGAIAGLQGLQGWLPGQHLSAEEVLVGLTASVRLVLEVLLWPVLGLGLILGPILVVEECSVWRALRQWAGLLRQHLGRLFASEALAVGLAALTTLPLLFPVALAAWSCTPAELSNPVVSSTLGAVGGLALAPLLAYLTVANVFIYLNLRYEYSPPLR